MSSAPSVPSASRVGWGSLRPPKLADVKGRGGESKAFAAPPPVLSFLVVLDFEWTADNRKKMEPYVTILDLHL